MRGSKAATKSRNGAACAQIILIEMDKHHTSIQFMRSFFDLILFATFANQNGMIFLNKLSYSNPAEFMFWLEELRGLPQCCFRLGKLEHTAIYTGSLGEKAVNK